MQINWSAVKGIIVRHLYGWKHDLDRVVDSFWWSSMDLIFWGLTSNYVSRLSVGVDLVILFLGGIIFWTVIQNSQREINMPLLDEAWNRNLINLFTTPLGLSEFIIATIILGMVKLTMVIVFLSSLAYFLYSYEIFVYGFFLIPAFANLILTGWWIGFIINALIFRYGYKIQAFAWAFIFVIYPFSAVLYPVEILPSWARIISAFLPTSYVFENMRKVISTGSFVATDVYIALTLNLIYMILAIAFLNKMFANALENGRLTKLN